MYKRAVQWGDIVRKLVYRVSGILIVCMSLLIGAVIIQIANGNNSSLSRIAVSIDMLVCVLGILLLVASSINEPDDN
ncbi:hypothetical protein ACFO3D_16360 [Virgibacillus kekensis]|uniref:Uncharacterized protein n=1 Tax=Virgibacillus kekensis TaxID=202261 RepID=A0ABV9DNK0_9BACI